MLLRTLVMTRAEAPSAIKQPHLLERPLNPENEAAALELLRLVLRKNLERQPGLQDDAQEQQDDQQSASPVSSAAGDDEAKEEQVAADQDSQRQVASGVDHRRLARRFALAHRRMLADSLAQLEGLASLNDLWELPESQVRQQQEFQAAVSAAEPRVQIVE